MNTINTAIQPDYLTIPLNTSKGVKDSYYINYLPVLNKALEANVTNPESIIHLLAPMGSGKTTFFKQLLTNIRANVHPTCNKLLTDCIMFTPFKVSNLEYEEYEKQGLKVEYLLDFAKTVFNSTIHKHGPMNTDVLHKAIVDYVIENYTDKIILIDEGDFKDVQVLKSKYTMDASNQSVIPDDELINTVIGTLCTVSFFNISVSANIMQQSIYYSCIQHVLNVPVNNHINNIYIYNTLGKLTSNVVTEMSKLMHSITTDKNHLLGPNAKTLIYSPKFNKSVFEELIINDPRSGVLIRNSNIPGTSNLKSKSNPNIMTIDNGHVLDDTLFQLFDNLGINTSSSRCTSLNYNYDNPWVIILQPFGVTSSCLQSLGRFRHSPINVLWIGFIPDINTWYENCVRVDPFFGSYTSSVSYINTVKCPYGIRGLDKPVERKFVSRVGMNNQATLEVNRILIEWLEANRGTLDAALRDYEVYKIQVVNPCGRAKFQEYHSICKKGGTFS